MFKALWSLFVKRATEPDPVKEQEVIVLSPLEVQFIATLEENRKNRERAWTRYYDRANRFVL